MVGTASQWPWAGTDDQHDENGARDGETRKEGVRRDGWGADSLRPSLWVTAKSLGLSQGKPPKGFSQGNDRV